ncbi:MAG: ThiF family adenylyltransferase [Patescibacteria group bacterium]
MEKQHRTVFRFPRTHNPNDVNRIPTVPIGTVFCYDTINMTTVKTAKRLAGKPLLLDVTRAHRTGRLRYQKDGSAVLRITPAKNALIPPANQFDLTQATIFGLNERLTQAATSPVADNLGKTLRDVFNAEWRRYSAALENARGPEFDYGVYAYYVAPNHLVRFCPPYWHRVVATASNSMLITDPKGKLGWRQIRKILAQTAVAVAGGSVGNSILHTIAMDLRPFAVKIADKGMYKMENINRVRLGYGDLVESNAKRTDPAQMLLRNKALVTAEQIYATDPFISVYAYPEGIIEETIALFLDGRAKEPKADVIVEEMDDPRLKIVIREEARKRGIPVLMLTDIGSAVQLDVLRYDKDRMLPLTYGNDDQTIRLRLEDAHDHPADRAAFFRFVDALIGKTYRTDELARIIAGKTEIPTSTLIPQLGSTVAMAGAIAAETIARIRLGHTYPPRAIINKKTFRVRIFR